MSNLLWDNVITFNDLEYDLTILTVSTCFRKDTSFFISGSCLWVRCRRILITKCTEYNSFSGYFIFLTKCCNGHCPILLLSILSMLFNNTCNKGC